MKTLFGDEFPENYNGRKASGYIARQKQRMMYRRATDLSRSCKTCVNLIGRPGLNRFYKCRKIGQSHSIATDIRLRNTCDHWVEKITLGDNR